MGKRILCGVAFVSMAWFGATGTWAEQPAAKPNVLVIYLDDMSWGQPGCYGGKMTPTPNIDALAARGVRFTSGYVSAPICSPSRVGMITGRYQARSGHDALTRPEWAGSELDINEVTFAQRMKDAGYVTGIVGKWHLGDRPDYLPASRGFDYSFGATDNVNEGKNGSRYYRGKELIADPPGTPVTSPLYRDEAIHFMEENHNKSWFLYLALNAVHSPFVASKEVLERFAYIREKEGRGWCAQYAALTSEADDAIGSVLTRLRELDLDKNTLVFLISDNGGTVPFAEPGGLRGRKWFLWEGGIRVPWIAAWEGHIPGGRVLDEPVIQLDVLPTALAAAGAEVRPEWQLDGVNLLPLLEGHAEKLEPRTLYWRFGVQYAVRQGDWKVVKALKDMKPELYNLADDPGEQTDLSSQYPEKLSNLQALWERWNGTMEPPRWEQPNWGGAKELERFNREQREWDALVRQQDADALHKTN